MNALVVYESHWGNTAAVARAIAEGLGAGATALTTAEATADVLAGADLIVAGAPVMAFRLPTESILADLAADKGKAPTPPDVSSPSMRRWLEALPSGTCPATAFETRLRWSPGGSIKGILAGLERAGHRLLPAVKFVVAGSYGPLRDGEIERARRWGAALAQTVGTRAPELAGSAR
ncbi:MAG: flavodoxin [Candidatus Limnocylindrales bacterium]